MFDKKNYIKDKIIKRLGAKNLLKHSMQINNLIDEMDNLDLVAYHGETFESSTIGWISFCDTIERIINSNSEITIENFKKHLGVKKTTRAKRDVDIIDPSLLVEEDPKEKLNRLAALSEMNDMAEDIDYDFLTDEGLKIVGAVNSFDTSLDAEDIKVDDSKLMPIVYVKKSDLNNNSLKSPYTGTKELHQMSNNVWMDLTTEQLFRVVYEEDKQKYQSSSSSD